MDVVFSVCIVMRGAVGSSCMGIMSVSSCRCCMFVSCVAVLTAALCMTCSLLMLLENARGDHMEEAYCRAGLLTALKGSHECLLLYPHHVVVSTFIIRSGLCACTEMVVNVCAVC